MGKSVLEELVTVLGFDLDDKDLKRFNQLSAEAHTTLKRIALVGTAAAAGFGVFINSVAVATDATFKFSQTLGASFAEVQRLTLATEIWGGTAADVMSTITGLATITSKAARGGGGGEIFGILGISPTDARTGGPKNTVALLKEIADQMDTMGSEARQIDLLGQLGISPNMILLLRKGSKGIEELGDEVARYSFILTPAQGKIAEDFVDATVRLRLALRGVATEIGLRLQPRITDMIGKFLEWREANRDVIDSGIVKFANLLAKAARPLAIFMALIAAALLIAAAIASPVAAAVAITIAAVSLLLDDIIAFMRGEGGTFLDDMIEWGRSNFSVPTLGGTLESMFRGDINFLKNLFNRSKGFLFPPTSVSPLGVSPGGGGIPTPVIRSFTANFSIRATDVAGVTQAVHDEITDMWAGSGQLA